MNLILKKMYKVKLTDHDLKKELKSRQKGIQLQLYYKNFKKKIVKSSKLLGIHPRVENLIIL